MNPLQLILGGGSILANMFGQNQTNKMQMEMMQGQQQFQEQMSSSAYQRASADMKAAGLNPMMMFGHGAAASSPAGAAPSASVKSGMSTEGVSSAINSATSAAVAQKTIDNLVEQNAKIKAETALTKENVPLTRERTGFTRALTNTEWFKGLSTAAQARILRNEAVTAANQESINPTIRTAIDQGAYGGQQVGKAISGLIPLSSARRAFSVKGTDRWPADTDTEVSETLYDREGDMSGSRHRKQTVRRRR